MTTDISLLIVAFFISSFITSVTGMAGGILMFSSATSVLPIRSAIAIHGVVQAFSNLWRSWLLRNYIIWPMLLPFLIGSLIGALLTTVFIADFITEQMALSILIVLISYSILNPKMIKELKITNKQFSVVGVITSSLGLIAGAIDPLLAIFFMRDDLSKEQIVATKSAMQFICHSIKIPAFIYLGFDFKENLTLITILTISATLGTFAGVRSLRKIPQNIFFNLMKIFLIISGLNIAYQLIF